MDNFLTFLLTKKGVLTVCASVSTVTFGSYQFNDYVSDRSILESLNIQFKQVASADGVDQKPTIEYGDTSFDLNSLIETKEGEVILPTLDVTKVGEQTLTFKVSKEDQEKEFTKTVNIQDTQGPEITLTSDSTSIPFEKEFDVASLITSVTDPVDGAIPLGTQESTTNYYMVDGSVDNTKPGDYTITVKAIDANGNESSASSVVTVKEKEKSPTEKINESASTNVAAFESGNIVADAALAQLGINQDCTALVSNALAAAGIHYHGYPAGYLSLGTVVSSADAQPGDVIYYADGGIGSAHVAIYIGGGQAVHGGWKGSTVIGSAYMGSGPVFIRLK